VTADPGARAAFIFRKLALVLLLAWSVAAAAESPIALDTGGGEAWTFEKLVEGSIPTGTCDAVALTSPRGTVAAPADGERFIARVPLGSGANVVQVQCLKEGVARGAPAEQRWFVRLRDAPKAQIRAQIIGEGIMLRGASEPAAAAAVAIASYEWHARPGNPAPLPGLPAIG
jgi:hypothetical protein